MSDCKEAYSQLSEFEKGVIVGMKHMEATSREIASYIDRDQSTVSRFYSHYVKTGDVYSKSGGARMKKLTDLEIRRIKIVVRRDPFITIRKIKEELGLDHVCERTIARELEKYADIKSYWAKKKPFISEKNQKIRLEWAKQHREWTVNQWRQVMWTDESPFMLRYQGKKRVLRFANERYVKDFMMGTVKHDKKINVWGCFSYQGVGDLCNVQGHLDQNQFKQILIRHLVPSMNRMFPDGSGIFQQDNDPKHTAHSVQDYLRSKELNILPWPSQSPDLNPIENLWHMLDWHMRTRRPQNEKELFKACQEAWNQLDIEYLRGLVDSMPARIDAVIAAKGGMTKY
jgi:Transposase/DDE superfamily endonuclease